MPPHPQKPPSQLGSFNCRRRPALIVVAQSTSARKKTLIGTGDAQVRTAASNQHLPAVTVAAYALLWVAALIVLAENQPLAFPRPPKRRKDRRETGRLPATGDLLRLLRAEIRARALNPGSFDHFATDPPPDASAQKPAPNLSATLFAAA
jgi:hypothetical protein